MRLKKIAGYVAAATVGITLLACGSGAVDDPSKKSASGAPVSASSKAPAAAPLPTKKAVVPTASQFKMSVKILSKECFGSAGCNVTFRLVKLEYSGEPLPADKTYEISYEIKGLQDPMQGTFEMQGDLSYSVEKEQMGQTASSKSKLTVKITDVAEL